MRPEDFTFGIEIETTVDLTEASQNGLYIGNHIYGQQVPYLPAGWKAKSDGSIRTTQPNRAGCEIVSPVLKGQDGLKQVLEVVKALEEKGHKVNATCGVHIHIGWEPTWGATKLARLITVTSYLEKAIYAITGTKNRERGQWCGGVRKYGKPDEAEKNMKGSPSGGHYQRERYHVLNITNLATGSQNTVEFRAFSGSLNPTKIAGWVQACIGIVQRALTTKKSPGWVPAAPGGAWKKDGPGASETERMLAYLGWTNGYARAIEKVQYGWLGLDGAPTQKQVAKEFRRLAKQYDAQA